MKNSIKIIFYISMAIGIIGTFLYGIITDHTPLINVLFNSGQAPFYDFWECISLNSGKNAFEQGSSYPAFATGIFALLSMLLPKGFVMDFGRPPSDLDASVFYLSMIVLISTLLFLLTQMKKGLIFEKYMFTMVILFSAPILYMLERGNIIFLALVFLIAFVLGKDSEKAWIRELSYLALACSAALKIYPAVFGLVLVLDKKYKAAMRCALYGVILFIAPFFVYDGYVSMRQMFINLVSTDEEFKLVTGYGYKINMSAFVSVLLIKLHVDIKGQLISFIISVLPYITSVVALIACFVHRTSWKTYALLAVVAVIIPNFSYVYALTFFIIPLTKFIDVEYKRTITDYIALVCFIGMFVLIPFAGTNAFAGFQTTYYYVASTFVQGMCVSVLAVTLIVDAVIIVIKSKSNRNEKTVS